MERIVEIPVEQIIENPYPVEVFVEVEVAYERVVERLIDNPIEQLIDNPVYYENIIERPYEQIVEVKIFIFFWKSKLIVRFLDILM